MMKLNIGPLATEWVSEISKATTRTLGRVLNVYDHTSEELLAAAEDLETLDDAVSMQSCELARILARGLRAMAESPEQGLEKSPNA
jgi:ABC-type transporter Mla subunit MlaD